MKKIISYIRVEILPLLIILLLVTAMRSSLADHYHVTMSSMEYSLHEGDRLIVDKTAYGFRLPYTKIDLVTGDDPVPGEIVVFDSPLDDKLLIKRVVAVAGDKVALVDGRLIINGELLAGSPDGGIEHYEKRQALLNLRDGGGADIGVTVVPRGMVLVLGDHRGNSIDGRLFGFLDKGELYGKAVKIYYRKGEGLTWRDI